MTLRDELIQAGVLAEGNDEPLSVCELPPDAPVLRLDDAARAAHRRAIAEPATVPWWRKKKTR